VNRIKSLEATETAAAAAHGSLSTLRVSWHDWQVQLELAFNITNAKSWFYSTKTHQAFTKWRAQVKLQCERLKTFEVHTETSHPTIFNRLDRLSPLMLWSTDLIATTHWSSKALPLVPSMWRLWRRTCHTIDPVYERLIRNWPTNIMRWTDPRSIERFIVMLRSRCKSIDVSATPQRKAKARAIIHTLRSKKMARAVKSCFFVLKLACTHTDLTGDSSNSNTGADSNSSSDSEEDLPCHFLQPDVSRAWRALRNITANTHSSEIPVPHLAAPVCTWSPKLSSSVSVMKEFSKLKHASSSVNQDVLQKIPAIDFDDNKYLLRPFRIWSTNLDQLEYDSADRSEIIASYSFTWCLPLWLDLQDGQKSVTCWDCCFNRYISIAAEACLPEDESDAALADQFLTFHGMSFAEPRSVLTPASIKKPVLTSDNPRPHSR
jgi:hypothetical protein